MRAAMLQQGEHLAWGARRGHAEAPWRLWPRHYKYCWGVPQLRQPWRQTRQSPCSGRCYQVRAMREILPPYRDMMRPPPESTPPTTALLHGWLRPLCSAGYHYGTPALATSPHCEQSLSATEGGHDQHCSHREGDVHGTLLSWISILSVDNASRPAMGCIPSPRQVSLCDNQAIRRECAPARHHWCAITIHGCGGATLLSAGHSDSPNQI